MRPFLGALFGAVLGAVIGLWTWALIATVYEPRPKEKLTPHPIATGPR